MEPSKTHSIKIDGKKLTWMVENLWTQSKGLPIFSYSIEDFDGFDQDVWFGDRVPPTINNVLMHLQKISLADFEYPIILSETGIIMDGIHRICKAHLEGRKSIHAVQFKKNPPPDTIENL